MRRKLNIRWSCLDHHEHETRSAAEECIGRHLDWPELVTTTENLYKEAHMLATKLAQHGKSFLDMIVNVDGKAGREQWTVRLERRGVDQ